MASEEKYSRKFLESNYQGGAISSHQIALLRCQFVTSAFNLHRDNRACQPPLYHALLFGLGALLHPGYPYAGDYKPVAERCPVTLRTQPAALSHSSLTPLYISYFLVGFSILKVNW